MAKVEPMTSGAMPVLNIPDIGLSENEYGQPCFKIASSCGVIEVHGGYHDRWYCFGNAEALIEAKLIAPEWLPGWPGNNKLSQTILFGNCGPSLYRGNPMGKKLGPCIRVKKVSKNHFSVLVPTTSEQTQILKAASQRSWVVRNQERSRQAVIHTAKIRTPTEKREALKFQLRVLKWALQLEIEESGFQLDAVSARAIGQNLEALDRLFDQVVINRALSEYGSNVVPFDRTE